jgi:gluconokinase
MKDSIVVMGVAGCGKSSFGQALAAATGMRLIEGDDFHSAGNRQKMGRGTPLDDSDRADWLDSLAGQLRVHPEGVVLTCSALKKAYREHLRQAAPRLRFVFMQIDRPLALERVAQRAGTHFFSASLVDSQFETLEPPGGEPGVLTVDASVPIAALSRQVGGWLGEEIHR